MYFYLKVMDDNDMEDVMDDDDMEDVMDDDDVEYDDMEDECKFVRLTKDLHPEALNGFRRPASLSIDEMLCYCKPSQITKIGNFFKIKHGKNHPRILNFN